MTLRLFDENPLLAECTADITQLTPCKEGFCALLNATIFFPRGGGQPCDGGTIAGVPLLDVYEEGGEILHILGAEPAERQGVACRINLQNRLAHMQQHSGQHVISALAQQLFANPTLIARIEEDSAHIEFEKAMTGEQLQQLQEQVDALVAKALPIRCQYFTPEEAAQKPVRGKITPHERVRLVEIEGFDLNACGGTHCADTSQIGPVRWVGQKQVRGAFRLYFRAGDRARADAKEKDLRQLRLGQLLDCENGPQIEAAVEALHQRVPVLEQSVQRLREQLVGAMAQNLLQNTQPYGNHRGGLFVLPQWENKELKALADLVTKEQAALLWLAAPQEETLSLLVCQQKGMDGANPGQLMKEFFAQWGGKGGGSQLLAQGSVPFTPQALEAFEELAHRVLAQE